MRKVKEGRMKMPGDAGNPPQQMIAGCRNREVIPTPTYKGFHFKSITRIEIEKGIELFETAQSQIASDNTI